MTEPKYSPLWFNPWGLLDETTGRHSIGIHSGEDYFCTVADYSIEEAKKRAALIVKAVNNHEKLIDMAREALNAYFKATPEDCKFDWVKWSERAEKLLADIDNQ
jgi:hypothetical protein